jgi:hypothetical protein
VRRWLWSPTSIHFNQLAYRTCSFLFNKCQSQQKIGTVFAPHRTKQYSVTFLTSGFLELTTVINSTLSPIPQPLHATCSLRCPPPYTYSLFDYSHRNRSQSNGLNQFHLSLSLSPILWLNKTPIYSPNLKTPR